MGVRNVEYKSHLKQIDTGVQWWMLCFVRFVLFICHVEFLQVARLLFVCFRFFFVKTWKNMNKKSPRDQKTLLLKYGDRQWRNCVLKRVFKSNTVHSCLPRYVNKNEAKNDVLTNWLFFLSRIKCHELLCLVLLLFLFCALRDKIVLKHWSPSVCCCFCSL